MKVKHILGDNESSILFLKPLLFFFRSGIVRDYEILTEDAREENVPETDV